MIRISKPNEFPTDHKFLVIIFSTSYIHHAADQRSIDAPGHGYGAYNEAINQKELIAIKDQDELQKELEKLYTKDKNRKDISVLEIGRVVPIDVSVKVHF